MQETYFTCNLGQAGLHPSKSKDFKNIPTFISQQAQHYGSSPAVGFYLPNPGEWNTRVLTFREVYNGIQATANLLPKIEERQTVALICSSNVEFLLVWLALMHVDHPVLLIAPQCTPKAIVELCKQSGVEHIFHDDAHEELARRSVEAGPRLSSHPIPFGEGHEAFSLVHIESDGLIDPYPKMQPTDTAYLHHTSGTSSGIPKPIPQSHLAGAGVQASLPSGATFTTTPLYHGGIADLFRAWTSNAMIWLFPSKYLPITARNVSKCLETTKGVAYFSSVPYVLEMMTSDSEGLKHLQRMEIVGVGGAALPVEIGNRLVERGVNLVSRYGSAECGFLMSSHRDYTKDKEWQYVRPGSGLENLLRFEAREGGLFELVVFPGWPHMAKTNREDGSFATSDLFMPHPEIKDAWRYHSRADAQLTLVTGKKFDPSPLESSIAASSPLLKDVFVFGNGRAYPGALLFRSEKARETEDKALVKALAEKVEKLNIESQSHARISRNMLVPMRFDEQPLEKSSKGTILRNRADERYAADIDAAYENVTMNKEEVADEEVEAKILEVVRSIMAPSSQTGSLRAETDLFAYGVDSVASVQIRHAIAQLVPSGNGDLPMTLVQDAGTVRGLAKKILDIRHGRSSAAESVEDQYQLMRNFVNEYGNIAIPDKPTKSISSSAPRRGGKIVLLTGPTGSIGSHLLRLLVSSPEIEHVHLLLRGASSTAAEERVHKALRFRKLNILKDVVEKTTVHTCSLGDGNLGLSDETYSMLAEQVDIIYHLAWSVDFLLPLRGFRQHFAGLQSLLALSLAHASYASKPAQFVFCSSTASVPSFSAISGGEEIPEVVLDDPNVSGGIGYSQSKWVAENVCVKASQLHPELRDEVTVVRVGQVSGDTVNGVWNKSEAYPLMLSSAKVTGCLPDLPGEKLDWIPVDVTAACFVELGTAKSPSEERTEDKGAVRALHVLNQDQSAQWASLVQSLSKIEPFEVVDSQTWLKRLEGLRESQDQMKSSHPSLKLLDFWNTAYGPSERPNGAVDNHRGLKFATQESIRVMPSLAKVRPVDEPYIEKLWAWIKRNV